MSTEKNLTPPLRNRNPALAYGKEGRPINLIVNFFPVTIKNEDITLVHYDVVIKNHADSEKIPKRIKKEIFKQWRISFVQVLAGMEIAYDGEKNAYSVNTIEKLKKNSFEVRLEENRVSGQQPRITASAPQAATTLPVGLEQPKDGKKKGKKKGKGTASTPAGPVDKSLFSIAFKKVDSIHLTELLNSLKQTGNKVQVSTHVLNILEIMFRHYRAEKYMQIGRNSFFSTSMEFGQPWVLGSGKEGSTGFFASLRPAAWKNGSILLNMDKSHCAFYIQQPVMNFINDIFQRQPINFNQPLDQRNKVIVQKELKGLKVRVVHGVVKRTYRVNGITPLGANRLTFKLEKDGKSEDITVEKYFFQQYGVKLKYPALNCLHVGNPQKSVYIPIELCEMEKGQRVLKKLNEDETAQFIRKTAVPAPDRLREIKDMAKHCNFPQDPILKSLQFTISDQPMQTVGRVLPDPNLQMQRETFRPRQGVWTLRNYRFHESLPLESWVVLNFDRYLKDNDLWTFLTRLSSDGKHLGMNIAKPHEVINITRPNEIEKRFHDLKNKYSKLQLIVCALDRRNLYATIKKTGDVDCKIITQCLMTKTILGRRGMLDGATITNILMKINAKLGGVNNIFQPDEKLRFDTVIVMGADVNHPPAGGPGSMPSIAAIVGSIDHFATKYAVEVRSQLHRKEIIVDMKEMVKNLLHAYRNNTGKVPSKIIMYRDGVSESQFSEVLGSEMLKMRAACTELSANFKPAITFICVQKRHHTRLFCQNPRDAVGRSGNVPPGTVVDKDITHPTEIDFYLCSHQGIQGTSRPAHYHVLWDDSDFHPDKLQRITYELCHVYSRCSRSVSIPTPAYYAHWAAFRSKTYASLIIDDDASAISGDSGPKEPSQQVMNLTNISKSTSQLSNRLYYI